MAGISLFDLCVSPSILHYICFWATVNGVVFGFDVLLLLYKYKLKNPLPDSRLGRYLRFRLHLFNLRFYWQRLPIGQHSH